MIITNLKLIMKTRSYSLIAYFGVHDDKKDYSIPIAITDIIRVI